MPNLPSGFKRMRQDKKRHERNLKIETELKSLAKKFTMAIAAKQTDEAKKTGMTLVSKLDKARTKGIIHRNTAARKRSRILTKLAKLK